MLTLIRKFLGYLRWCHRPKDLFELFHALSVWPSVLYNYFLLICLKTLIKARHPKKTLIAISLVEHFGDIVACEPVARYICQAYPNGYIIWIVRKSYKELVKHNPFINRIVVVSCLTGWIYLKATQIFDRVIDLHFANRSCPTCGISNIKDTGDLAINFNNYYYYGALLPVFCRIAGLPPIEDGPQVYIPDCVGRAIDKLNLPKHFIVFHCLSNDYRRDWQSHKWIDLALLVSRELNIPVVEIGTKAEIAGNHNCGCIDLCGKLSLLKSAEVIRRASLFVGIDSGPAHLANAVGTYGVILLGTFHRFTRYMPYTGGYSNGSRARFICNDMSASEIGVKEVFDQIKSHLSSYTNINTTDVLNTYERTTLQR